MLNLRALRVFDHMVRSKDEIGVEVLEIGGSTVIDAGVKVRGSFEAGVYISLLTISDLGDVKITHTKVGGMTLPAVRIFTHSPFLSLMASQLAGWSIKVGNFQAMGSGPARILARKPKKLFEKMEYSESCEHGVIFLESSSLPTPEAIHEIASKCGISPENLRVAVASSSSMSGVTQIAARVAESGLHKMYSLGMDVRKVRFALGVAPIPPLAGDDVRCSSVANDCIMYCGETYYVVDGEEFLENASMIPSCSSKQYGKPFYDIFREANFDFYSVDPLLFAPAVVTINEAGSGKTVCAGKKNEEVLLRSFGVS